MRLDKDSGEPAEVLRKAGDDGSVASCVVVQLKEGSCHQLVVARHSKKSFEGLEILFLSFWSGWFENNLRIFLRNGLV